MQLAVKFFVTYGFGCRMFSPSRQLLGLSQKLHASHTPRPKHLDIALFPMLLLLSRILCLVTPYIVTLSVTALIPRRRPICLKPTVECASRMDGRTRYNQIELPWLCANRRQLHTTTFIHTHSCCALCWPFSPRVAPLPTPHLSRRY